MIAPTNGRGLISPGSMLTIKSQKSICKSYRARRKSGNIISELPTSGRNRDLANQCSCARTVAFLLAAS
jgi:hypothetical protein